MCLLQDWTDEHCEKWSHCHVDTTINNKRRAFSVKRYFCFVRWHIKDVALLVCMQPFEWSWVSFTLEISQLTTFRITSLFETKIYLHSGCLPNLDEPQTNKNVTLNCNQISQNGKKKKKKSSIHNLSHLICQMNQPIGIRGLCTQYNDHNNNVRTKHSTYLIGIALFLPYGLITIAGFRWHLC